MEEEPRRGSLHLCFGEHNTTLFDEFELLTFEIQLNRAILRRCLSEPITPLRFKAEPECCAKSPPPPPPSLPRHRRRPLTLSRALRWLLRRVFGGGRWRGAVDSEPSDPRTWKAFSKSCRV